MDAERTTRLRLAVLQLAVLRRRGGDILTPSELASLGAVLALAPQAADELDARRVLPRRRAAGGR